MIDAAAESTEQAYRRKVVDIVKKEVIYCKKLDGNGKEQKRLNTILLSPVLVSPIALAALLALSPICLLVFSANSFVRLPNTLRPVNA